MKHSVLMSWMKCSWFFVSSKAQLNGTLTSIAAGEKVLQAVLQSGEKSHDVNGSVKVTPHMPVMVIFIW